MAPGVRDKKLHSKRQAVPVIEHNAAVSPFLSHDVERSEKRVAAYFRVDHQVPGSTPFLATTVGVDFLLEMATTKKTKKIIIVSLLLPEI